MTLWVVGSALAFLSGVLLACDSSTEPPACESQTISSDLTRVMYWGRVSAIHDEPNKGSQVNDIRLPLWHADDKIFVATLRLDQGILVSGIFDISIDPATSRFRSLNTLKFPNNILAFEYLQDSGDFLITYSTGPDQPSLARVHAAGDVLQIAETLYDSTWMPAAARVLATAAGAVVYFAGGSGRSPGFYFVPLSSAMADSLILEETLSYSDGLGFDVSDSTLYYGVTTGDFLAPRTLVMKQNLVGGLPTVIADLEGLFSGLSVNQNGTCVLVAGFNPNNATSTRGGVISAVDVATGQKLPIDVRTRQCGHYSAAFPSWSPNGTRFAFISNHFSAESGESPLELWARRAVMCPK